MMKYWFGTINIYVWIIKNPFFITKTYENNENTSNFQFQEKYFSLFSKIGRKSMWMVPNYSKFDEKNHCALTYICIADKKSNVFRSKTAIKVKSSLWITILRMAFLSLLNSARVLSSIQSK